MDTLAAFLRQRIQEHRKTIEEERALRGEKEWYCGFESALQACEADIDSYFRIQAYISQQRERDADPLRIDETDETLEHFISHASRGRVS